MKRALLVTVVVVLAGAGVISGYLWGHHSDTTLPASDNGASAQGWTGEYFWQTGPADDPTDAVLLTLLQSPSGVSGTWTETASSGVYPIGGPSIGGISPGGSGSTQIETSNVTARSVGQYPPVVVQG
jgi:hypothetical protein